MSFKTTETKMQTSNTQEYTTLKSTLSLFKLWQ